MRNAFRIGFFAAVLVVFAIQGVARQTREVSGTIADPTGAVIVAASVTLDDGQGHKYSSQTDEKGRYRFNNIPGAVYTLTVSAEGFESASQQVDLSAGRVGPVNLTLQVSIKQQQMEVKSQDLGVSTAPESNLSAITLSGRDLESLPDDPDDLLTTLRQMAGATEDASVYVDGFREGGRLPPKEAILAIRINSNPFSPEFSEPGFGRIEIITKPGTSAFHGGFRFNFDDSALNARNAFATTRTPYQYETYNAFLSGPIIKNRWDFFFDFERRNIKTDQVVNATVLDPTTLNQVPFVADIVAPNTLTNFSIRTNYLLTKKYTAGLWFRHTGSDQENQGVGGFNLPELAATSTSRDNTLRFTLTTIVTETAVNEFRMELSRRSNGAQAVNTGTEIQVSQAFTSGGNQGQLFTSGSTDHLNFYDSFSYTHKNHTFKFGFQNEAVKVANTSRANYGGVFSFGVRTLTASDGTKMSITPIQNYQGTLEHLAGYGPTRFEIQAGDPFTGFTQWQEAWFAQDDWKISPRLTLSFGIRHEFQTHLDPKLNFAPRAALAWSPDKARKSVIRLGWGIFLTRLDTGITLNTIRLDGTHQQDFVVKNPTFFPNIPAQLSGGSNSIYTEAPGLKAPYAILSNVSYERQLPLKLFGSIGYSYQRAVHLFDTLDINAPNPVTGLFPFPNQGPILQYGSSGISKRHEMRVSLRTGFGGKVSVFSTYLLSTTHSDTDGSGFIPANSYDLAADYGRASFDQRHRLFVGSSVTLPWQVRVSPFIFLASGRPFNIVTGSDNNGDLQFNDRPAFAQLHQAGAIVTNFGIFSANPNLGDVIVPRNFGNGPGIFTLNMTFSKTFGFGPPPSNAGPFGRGNRRAGGGGPPPISRPGGPGGYGDREGGGFFGGDPNHRYSLTVALAANNIINHTNPLNYNGILVSPLFGLATQAASARTLNLSVRFNF
ncbi:MAG TPA: carboxypeptidase regulatory-like domain-containing protein [Blastocatellia bacterium]|nr:carboxypeptidase regulatory-like domain-containing protein [Blastocatellia bacterium]